jgi:hypothetical protein
LEFSILSLLLGTVNFLLWQLGFCNLQATPHSQCHLCFCPWSCIFFLGQTQLYRLQKGHQQKFMWIWQLLTCRLCWAFSSCWQRIAIWSFADE